MSKTKSQFLSHCGLFALIGLLAPGIAHAQIDTLATFGNGTGTGPYYSVTLDNGILYGTTAAGGAGNNGTIYSLPIAGGSITTLAAANSFGSDPTYLTIVGSTIYGSADPYAYNQTGVQGEIFSLPLSGGTPTVLTSVSGTQGLEGLGSPVISGSTIYGTSSRGGSYDSGTVYSLPISGGTATTLANFNSVYPITQQGASGTIGYSGQIVVSGNTIYGTTQTLSLDSNGVTTNYNSGTIFALNLTTHAVSTLSTFNANGLQGVNPQSLVLSGNTLYGTTLTGGADNDGTVFSVSTTTGAVTTLATFTGANGSGPALNEGLVLNGNTLYGTTTFGGANNDGTVFEVATTGGALTTLATFNGTNGALPESGVIYNKGILYGTTERNNGTVYSLSVNPPTQSTNLTPTNGSAVTYSSIPAVTSSSKYSTQVALVGGETTTAQTVTIASTALGGSYKSLASDVVSVSGNAGSTFTVQLTFDLSAANAVGGASKMTLLWLDPATNAWVNAIVGNTGLNTTDADYLDYQGSFAQFEAQSGATDANLSSYLGAYGVDTTNDTVWAVIDHNSNFGVGNLSDLPEAVPEPSTWAMLLLGALGLLAHSRMVRKSSKRD